MFGNYIEEYINNLRQDRDLRGDSTRWANWMSELLPVSCKFCVDQHGKIFDISVLKDKDEVEAHRNCKCLYVPMRTKKVGTATDLGMEGADVYIFYYGYLPDYYVTQKQAQRAGWQSWKGNLDEVLPNAMIGGDVYKTTAGNYLMHPEEYGMKQI